MPDREQVTTGFVTATIDHCIPAAGWREILLRDRATEHDPVEPITVGPSRDEHHEAYSLCDGNLPNAT